MAQTQSFVSCAPAHGGEQVREQPLRTPGARICHPDLVTPMAIIIHPISDTCQRSLAGSTHRLATPGPHRVTPGWKVPLQASPLQLVTLIFLHQETMYLTCLGIGLLPLTGEIPRANQESFIPLILYQVFKPTLVFTEL